MPMLLNYSGNDLLVDVDELLILNLVVSYLSVKREHDLEYRIVLKLQSYDIAALLRGRHPWCLVMPLTLTLYKSLLT